ncbi:cytochrome P450 [Hymenopellis radicata]|nr:cytochrome P450 [Hymenopellis radicata]
MLSTHALAALFLCLLFVLWKWRVKKTKSNPLRLPYPPGPQPIPMLGNILDIPRDNEAQRYNALARRHGDLVYMQVFGISILVVNTYEAANDLFEKRSAMYSDRSPLPMINDLMGWDWSFGHMPYGKSQACFHFQPSAVSKFWPIQRVEVEKLLRRLLYTPEDFMEHLRHNSASIIMNVTYGMEISDSKDDDYIRVAEIALDGMAKAAHPGAFLVDIFPILKYVPRWFPFATFKRKAEYWRNAVLRMRDGPYAFVKNALVAGTASPCFVTYLLSELDTRNLAGRPRDDEETKVRACAGLALAAGAESIVSSLSSFLLAVVLHPEVQHEAQAELDAVVGHGRMPDFCDRMSLPYIDCIVKEDDDYRGYFIPKGTTVIGNSWTILHDPSVFPDPSKFNPSRFKMGGRQHDHISVAFGYGRRICPGRYMAVDQLWLSIAAVLSLFDIRSCGPTEARFASGMISHPLRFRCEIKPRAHAKRIIEELDLDIPNK